MFFQTLLFLKNIVAKKRKKLIITALTIISTSHTLMDNNSLMKSDKYNPKKITVKSIIKFQKLIFSVNFFLNSLLKVYDSSLLFPFLHYAFNYSPP